MADVLTMRDKAAAIADSALRAQRGANARQALIDHCMEALVAAGLDAQRTRSGREVAIFERDFGKVGILVDALLSGQYRDTACRLADIAESGVRAWMRAADDGDPRYKTIAALIRAAEAISESECVDLVRAAGKDPRNWAAAMTWLERKFPAKYGRRNEEKDTPTVVVYDLRNTNVHVEVSEPKSGACSSSRLIEAAAASVE